MCGIVGYVGARQAQPMLLEGLRRLEYRGYDSAGLATLDRGVLHVRKKAGRVADLESFVQEQPAPGMLGISHTRWATHGGVTDRNAHPHLDTKGIVAVVHNGVIENYSILRDKLSTRGHTFASDTDTETIAHLIAHHLAHHQHPALDSAQFAEAVRQSLPHLIGTYGLAIISPLFPNVLIGARLGSPLLLGIGDHEYWLASDQSALSSYTKDIVYINDGELVVATPEGFTIRHVDKGPVTPQVHHVGNESYDVDKGEFDHFMRKEIDEQPATVLNALRGRIDEQHATARFGGLNLSNEQLASIKRIILTACGTSWHAALVGEYLLEEYAGIPVEVEYASELRYRHAPVDPGTVLVCLSQSGETADTLAVLRECKRREIPTLALTNVVGSSIAREASGGIYLHAGPEIGVASTKAFTAQLTVLFLLTLYLGRQRGLSLTAGQKMIAAFRALPELIKQVLATEQHVHAIAHRYQDARTMLYLGRGYTFPIALEGALKLKEVSYIHAEGYPAAEMKHGPIALVDEQTPSIIITPQGPLYDKVMSNLEEIKARGGPVIAIATKGDGKIAKKADEVVYIPKTEEYLQPFVTVIPLQLLAYHMALLRNCDVDKPRNLAKSVTVE